MLRGARHQETYRYQPRLLLYIECQQLGIFCMRHTDT